MTDLHTDRCITVKPPAITGQFIVTLGHDLITGNQDHPPICMDGPDKRGPRPASPAPITTASSSRSGDLWEISRCMVFIVGWVAIVHHPRRSSIFAKLSG